MILLCQIIAAIIKADPMTIINNFITITILLFGVIISIIDYATEIFSNMMIFCIYGEDDYQYFERKQAHFYSIIYREIKRQANTEFSWKNIWNVRSRGYFNNI